MKRASQLMLAVSMMLFSVACSKSDRLSSDASEQSRLVNQQKKANQRTQLSYGDTTPVDPPPDGTTLLYYYYKQSVNDYGCSTQYFPNGMWGGYYFAEVFGYALSGASWMPTSIAVRRYFNAGLVDNYYTTYNYGPSLPNAPAWVYQDTPFYAFSQGGDGRIPIYSYVSRTNGHHLLHANAGETYTPWWGPGPYEREDIAFWVYPS